MRFLLLLSALFVSLTGLVAGEGARAGQVVEQSVGRTLAASVRSATLSAPHRVLIPAEPLRIDVPVRAFPPLAYAIPGADARLRV